MESNHDFYLLEILSAFGISNIFCISSNDAISSKYFSILLQIKAILILI